MMYGVPEGFKEKVLAVIADSSTKLYKNLNVLGFNYNSFGHFWIRKDFQPHVVKALESFGIQPSKAVLDEYSQKTTFKPTRIFKHNFKSEMLLDYQKEALEFAKNAQSCVIALSIGLGKSPTSMGYADYLGQRTLVVCPASLRGQWFDELKKFNNLDPSKIVIDGSREKREKQWGTAKKCQYVICSYDLMRQKNDLDKAKLYLNGNGLLIFDEIMRIKNRESKRTKACIDLRNKAFSCIGLTGQPVDNNLGEFYTILNIVSPGFVPSYEKFAEMFLVRELRQGPNGRSYWQILGERNVDEFRDLIKPLVIRKEKREVLNLPPTSTIIRTVELSKEQKRIEKRLLELAKEDPDNILKYFTYSRENLISPALLPVEILDAPRGLDLWSQVERKENLFLEYIPSKVQELLEGKIKPEDIELTPRLLEVKDILEESGKEKIIVFSTYVKALELVKRCLTNEDCAMVAGDYNTEDEIEKFRGDTRILLASEKAQEGLNLQHCSSMIILNSSWTFSRMEQLRGRIERKGQIHPMTFYELNSNSVIESRINKILKKKEKLSEKVLARRVMEK